MIVVFIIKVKVKLLVLINTLPIYVGQLGSEWLAIVGGFPS